MAQQRDEAFNQFPHPRLGHPAWTASLSRMLPVEAKIGLSNPPEKDLRGLDRIRIPGSSLFPIVQLLDKVELFW